MSQMRQRDSTPESRLRDGDSVNSEDGERLAAARGEIDRLSAAADAILDRIKQGDSAKFLEQVRQQGGE